MLFKIISPSVIIAKYIFEQLVEHVVEYFERLEPIQDLEQKVF